MIFNSFSKIKIWDLKLALEQRTSASSLCIQTLIEHTGRVFRLQFDEFQIVSSSHDDTIIIWDFLNDQQKAEGASLPSDINNANLPHNLNSSNNSYKNQLLNPSHLWLPNGASSNNTLNIDISNNPNNQQDLSSPSTSPLSQSRNLRRVNNNQNSPPSPMGDD